MPSPRGIIPRGSREEMIGRLRRLVSSLPMAAGDQRVTARRAPGEKVSMAVMSRGGMVGRVGSVGIVFPERGFTSPRPRAARSMRGDDGNRHRVNAPLDRAGMFAGRAGV